MPEGINWLGSGMARKAGEKLKSRKSRIDRTVSGATSSKKKKGEWKDKEKTKYGRK